MGLRQSSEDRWFPRYHEVSRNFSGKLAREADGLDLDARVIDVSRDGLGVVLPMAVRNGEVLVLTFEGRQIPFVVAHCNPDLIHRDSFRVGLQRKNGTTDNLVSLFRTANMLAPER